MHERTVADPAAGYLFGTLTMMLGAQWWYEMRIADAAKRAAFARASRTGFEEAVTYMRDRLFQLFADVEACLAGARTDVPVER